MDRDIPFAIVSTAEELELLQNHCPTQTFKRITVTTVEYAVAAEQMKNSPKTGVSPIFVRTALVKSERKNDLPENSKISRSRRIRPKSQANRKDRSNLNPHLMPKKLEPILFVKRNRHLTGVQEKIMNTDPFCLVFEPVENCRCDMPSPKFRLDIEVEEIPAFAR